MQTDVLVYAQSDDAIRLSRSRFTNQFLADKMINPDEIPWLKLAAVLASIVGEDKTTMKVCMMEQAISSASNGCPTHPGSVAALFLVLTECMQPTKTRYNVHSIDD